MKHTDLQQILDYIKSPDFEEKEHIAEMGRHYNQLIKRAMKFNVRHVDSDDKSLFVLFANELLTALNTGHYEAIQSAYSDFISAYNLFVRSYNENLKKQKSLSPRRQALRSKINRPSF